METKNNTNESSRFSCGRYEILFASATPSNPYDFDSGMQYINGALCNPDTHYKYHVKWEVKGKKISSIDFIMPDDKATLSTFF